MATLTEGDLPKRRAPGRPKKKISRTGKLMVRLTPAERLLVESRAKAAKINSSEWFRRAAKSATIQPRFSPEETGWFRMLSGLANNLNQLTRLAHTQGISSLALKCQAILLEIDKLLKKISSDDR